MKNNPLQKLKDDARAEVAYIVLNRDCTCGFGEKRGTQCDCGFEVRQSTYLSHRFLDTLIEKVVAAVEKEVVPNQRIVGMSNPPATDIGNSDKHIGWNACRTETLEAFNNFRTMNNVPEKKGECCIECVRFGCMPSCPCHVEKETIVTLAPEGTLMAEFQKERTDAITDMFDNANDIGIYPTSQFFKRLDDCVESIIARTREEAVAEDRKALREKVVELGNEIDPNTSEGDAGYITALSDVLSLLTSPDKKD